MMATNMVVTCDVCGADGAHSYVVSVEGAKWHVDLCTTDAGPLWATAKYGRQAKAENDIRPSTQRILEGRIRGVSYAVEE